MMMDRLENTLNWQQTRAGMHGEIPLNNLVNREAAEEQLAIAKVLIAMGLETEESITDG